MVQAHVTEKQRGKGFAALGRLGTSFETAAAAPVTPRSGIRQMGQGQETVIEAATLLADSGERVQLPNYEQNQIRAMCQKEIDIIVSGFPMVAKDWQGLQKWVADYDRALKVGSKIEGVEPRFDNVLSMMEKEGLKPTGPVFSPLYGQILNYIITDRLDRALENGDIETAQWFNTYKKFNAPDRDMRVSYVVEQLAKNGYSQTARGLFISDKENQVTQAKREVACALVDLLSGDTLLETYTARAKLHGAGQLEQAVSKAKDGDPSAMMQWVTAYAAYTEVSEGNHQGNHQVVLMALRRAGFKAEDRDIQPKSEIIDGKEIQGLSSKDYARRTFGHVMRSLEFGGELTKAKVLTKWSKMFEELKGKEAGSHTNMRATLPSIGR